MKRLIERYFLRGVYLFMVAATLALVASGCCSTTCVAGRTNYRYRYHVVHGDEQAMLVAAQPVTLHYGPLEYFFIRAADPDCLEMRIINPTEHLIVMVGEWSFVTDPKGIQHPLRDRVLGPGGYSGMSLPTEPRIYPSYQGWPGGIIGFVEPMSGPLDGPPYYYWPNDTFYGIKPPYEWQWKGGTARLRLEYETEGRSFEHDFVLVRERVY